MDFTQISHLFLALMLLFAFVYGLCKSYKKRGALYMQVVTYSIGSMLLSELSNAVMFLCYGEIDNSFFIDDLGKMGFFLFTWSLAFGQFDSLGDDRTPKYKKYRLIAQIQPLIFIGAFIADLFSPVSVARLIFNAVLLLPMATTSYYCLKHLIIPDVKYGIFSSMRKYNICLLFITLFSGADIVLNDFGLIFITNILRIILAIDFVILVSLASKGVKQWIS